MQGVIDQLLKENQTCVLRERRSVQRQPFARPVFIRHGRDHLEVQQAFSKDLSRAGIGIVSDTNWTVGRIAELEIHRLQNRPVRFKAEVRWCEPYGPGWYLTGWHFLQVV